MSLFFYFVALCYVHYIAAQTCFPLNETVLVPGTINKRLNTYQISHLMEFTLDRCVLECLLVRGCKSFNYREKHGICELNSANLNDADDWKYENETDFVYHDIQNWNYEIAGTCSSRPCEENKRCVRTNPHTCVDVDCGPPPKYLLTVEDHPDWYPIVPAPGYQTSLGSVVPYQCPSSRMNIAFWISNQSPYLNQPIKMCGSDAQWSTNSLDCHSDLDSCEGIRACNPAYGDGDYWIYRTRHFYEKVKVYCHDMDSVPKTYITLPQGENEAYDAGDGTGPSSTVFSKIRIDTDFIVIRSDFTFASSTGGDVAFGEAASCLTDVNDDKVYGYFKINTGGTGLKLKEDQTAWQTSTELTELTELVNLTFSGSAISGYCWGSCGRCFPGVLQLNMHSGDVVDGSNTVLPFCA